MTSPPLSLHLPRVSVLLAVLAVALGWGGTATAGCGDHVVVLKPAGTASVEDTPPPKPPCQGPHCSADPAIPLPAPTTGGVVPTATVKELFSTTVLNESGEGRPCRTPFAPISACPIDRATSIFHPPRV